MSNGDTVSAPAITSRSGVDAPDPPMSVRTNEPMTPGSGTLSERWRRLRSSPSRLNLALQGGGAHGAFTWGVLDALLEDARIRFEGLSGSSAGAMNAVVFANGWMTGGRDGARQGLADFWTEMGRQMPLGMVTQGAGDAINLSAAGKLLATWAGYFSPSQLNPFDLNPLRSLLERQVDFEQLRARSPFKLFVGTTQANTGKLRVFRESDVVGRVGGDEFAVFAVLDEHDGASAVSGRLLAEIEKFNEQAVPSMRISMSFGIEELSSHLETPLDVLLSRADQAMYEKKRRRA